MFTNNSIITLTEPRETDSENGGLLAKRSSVLVPRVSLYDQTSRVGLTDTPF